LFGGFRQQGHQYLTNKYDHRHVLGSRIVAILPHVVDPMAEYLEKPPVGLLCFHCGNSIQQFKVSFENKNFCCEGCKCVFQILNENGMGTYYSLQSAPGTSQLNRHEQTFDYLDKQDVIDKLIDFQDDKRTRILFRIPAIHCSACIWLLENLPKLKPGILSGEVNFSRKSLLVSYDHHIISLRQLTTLLYDLGYMPDITFDDLSKEKKKNNPDRSFIYKLGIAGFAFGNIMLFSFPEYFHLDDIIDPGFRSFFGYLNLLLSLPVILYSGSGYFVSAWQAIKHKFINIDVPLALGIAVMFIRSSYEIISAQGAGFMDALVGLVFFLLIGKWFQNKTYGALSFDRDYKSYLPVSVTRINDSGEKRISLEDIAIGDTLLIRNNEMIPADSILLNGHGLIDYSFVTGESENVERISGDKVFAGGRQLAGMIQVTVVKSVSQSYLTELWNQELFSKKEPKNIKNRVTIISKYFTIAILTLALLTAFFWWMFDPSKILNSFTAILIITCPCALALTLPFTFGNALRIFNKNHLYLKNSATIENLSKITAIVFDKTGTITTHQQSSIEFCGDLPPEHDLSVFKYMLKSSNHPLSKTIYATLEVPEPLVYLKITEIPGSGMELIYNNDLYKVGSPTFVGMHENENTENEFRSSRVFISKNNIIYGFYRIRNEYRAGVDQLVTQLSGYHLHVLSGDNNGEEKHLKKIFGNGVPLYFNQTPLNKLSYIEELQSRGEKVLMVGDGLNDAGALKQANVGFAITEDTNNFFPASDGMLKAESLTKLPAMLKFSKRCMMVMRYSFFISLVYNLIGLSFAVRGELLPVMAAIIMPLSSISVISFTVFTSTRIGRKLHL
jgi:Cu+-exporting ATPase